MANNTNLLSNNERAVMRAVYELAKKKGSELMTLEDIYVKVKPVRRVHILGIFKGAFITVENPIENEEEVRKILTTLENQEYIELTEARKKDGEVFVVNLLNKGYNFPREEKDRVKFLKLWAVRIVAGAVASFIIGAILKSCFSC